MKIFFKDDAPEIINNTFYISGKIEIGDEYQCFKSSLVFWNKEAYLSQWKKSLKQFVNEDLNSTYLLTDVSNPDYANFFFWWILYKDGALVRVQEAILFTSDLNENYDLLDLYEYIPSYESHTEDGVEISEWTTSLYNLKTF